MSSVGVGFEEQGNVLQSQLTVNGQCILAMLELSWWGIVLNCIA